MRNFLLGAFCLASIVGGVAALPAISVKGAKFFADGEQFFLNGIAYQGTPADPLADTRQCQLDADLMRTIGTNSIRVYHINPFANHDGCMKAFSDAGIYLWLDLETFNTSINQLEPQWTEAQFIDYAHVMDTFQQYDNLAGFWIGNEVINTSKESASAPYIKAALADVKSYLVAKEYRQILIGYAAADIAELGPMLQNYLACGSNPNQSIDFFGLNSYEWCGDATYDTPGYHHLQEISDGYPIPIFFSETGCIVSGERKFEDPAAIYGSKMIGTWSGSMVYDRAQEGNQHRLVNYPKGNVYSSAPTGIESDFENLARECRKIDVGFFSTQMEADYTSTRGIFSCLTPTRGWLVDGDVPLPRLESSIIQAIAGYSSIQSVPQPTSSSALTSPSNSNSYRPGSRATLETQIVPMSYSSFKVQSRRSEQATAMSMVPGIRMMPAATASTSSLATGSGNSTQQKALHSKSHKNLDITNITLIICGGIIIAVAFYRDFCALRCDNRSWRRYRFLRVGMDMFCR